MAIAFPRAPTVQPGEAVTSRQLAGLAAAFNARLRSGLGDPTFRLRFYLLSMGRQIRNPDASGMLWPAQHEFFTAYQMLDPDQYQWPLTGPGEPEGVNAASQMGAFVFGNEAAAVESEAGRLDMLPWKIDGETPATPTDCWTLGKWQRGAWDPQTGAVGCPAWNAARAWGGIAYSRHSPHGNAYGGYLPTPQVISPACEDPDPDDGIPAPTNYEIKFKALVEGLADKVYAGTCQPAPGNDYHDHVAGIGYMPWAYIVLLNNGTVDVLPTNQYVEGPYEGAPRLAKTPNDALPRVLNTFAREFRGAAQQQAAVAGSVPGSWNAESFDFQRFMTSQYLLAPARGSQIGDSVMPIYPAAVVAAPGAAPYVQPAGTLATYRAGGTTWPVAASCVVAGWWAKSTYLADSVRLELVADGQVRSSLTLSHGAEDALQWLEEPIAAGAQVSIRLANQAGWSQAGGNIQVELAELYAYKPDLSDLMLVLRMQSATESNHA